MSTGVLWLLGWIGASFASESVTTLEINMALLTKHRFWHLFLSQGLLIGIAGGVTWLPAAPVLAQWEVDPKQHRSID